MSKDVECWCSYLPVPAVTSSHHWLRGVGPATSSITKAASSWRKRHRQAVTREKRTFVQQPRCKHFSKCSRMGAASNGTFSSNFSVTLIRQRAVTAPLSSPGSSCRFNGLRPKFIGKDCAVPSPKKPGRKSERWDSGLANSVLDRSWIEIDGYYILDGAI